MIRTWSRDALFLAGVIAATIVTIPLIAFHALYRSVATGQWA